MEILSVEKINHSLAGKKKQILVSTFLMFTFINLISALVIHMHLKLS